MRHPPKRYTSEEMILADIDKVHNRIAKLKKKAQVELDCEALYADADLVKWRQHHDEANELLGKIRRLQNTRLVRLGLTLAEFRTAPLPVDGLDSPGVILSRMP